jgi:hypothetical protein
VWSTISTNDEHQFLEESGKPRHSEDTRLIWISMDITAL